MNHGYQYQRKRYWTKRRCWAIFFYTCTMPTHQPTRANIENHCMKTGQPYITKLITRVIQVKSWFGSTCRRSKNSYFPLTTNAPHSCQYGISRRKLKAISNTKEISSKELPRFGGVKRIVKVRVFCEHRVTTTPVLSSSLPESQTHPMKMNWRCRPRALDEKESRQGLLIRSHRTNARKSI